MESNRVHRNFFFLFINFKVIVIKFFQHIWLENIQEVKKRDQILIQSMILSSDDSQGQCAGVVYRERGKYQLSGINNSAKKGFFGKVILLTTLLSSLLLDLKGKGMMFLFLFRYYRCVNVLCLNATYSWYRTKRFRQRATRFNGPSYK